MIISSSVAFVNLILMWIWDEQGFQFLKKPNKFEEKKKKSQTFETIQVSVFNTAGGAVGGGVEGCEAGLAALRGSVFCACHTFLAPGPIGWPGRLAPCPPRGTKRWPNSEHRTGGTPPLALP